MENVVNVTGDLKIRNVGEFWQNICRRCSEINETSATAVIDFGEVTAVDGAGIQLVLYIFKLAKEAPKSYAVKNVSEAIRNMGSSLGVKFEQSEVL